MARNSNRTKNRRRRRPILTQPRQLEGMVNFYDDDDKQSETDDLSEVFSKLPAKTEILSEIFSRLPPQAIFKFRCVSKSLSNLIQQGNFIRKYSSNFRPLIRCAITGLYFQQRCWLDYACLPCTPAFVLVDSESGCLPDPSLDYLAQKGGRMEAIEVFDSCNGLLLCRRNALESYGVSFTFFVTNPLTMEKIVLPPLRWDRVEHALLAELTSSGCLRYKVLCLFRSKHGDPCSKLLIFSSEIGEWERCEERLPPVCEKTLMGSKVFFKGRLFWDCLEGYILICHLNVKRGSRCCELIEAPRAPLGRCLWVFEDKLRCYCHGFPNEFPAWSLCVNNDETRKLKWKLEGCEEFETLSEDVSRIAEKWVITRKVMPRIRFKIVAYNSSSMKLFLFIPDLIYSYKLTKRKLKMLWTGAYDTWKFDSPSCTFPYVHNLAHIETRLVARKEKDMDDDNVKKKKDLIGSDLIQTHTFEELVSLYENSANMVKPCRKAQKGPFLA